MVGSIAAPLLGDTVIMEISQVLSFRKDEAPIIVLLLSHLSFPSLGPSPPPCASPGSVADCLPPPSEHLRPGCWWPPGTCPGTAGARRAAGPEVLYWPAQPELSSVEEELLPLSAGEKNQPSCSVTWPLEGSGRHSFIRSTLHQPSNEGHGQVHLKHKQVNKKRPPAVRNKQTCIKRSGKHSFFPMSNS